MRKHVLVELRCFINSHYNDPDKCYHLLRKIIDDGCKPLKEKQFSSVKVFLKFFDIELLDSSCIANWNELDGTNESVEIKLDSTALLSLPVILVLDSD